MPKTVARFFYLLERRAQGQTRWYVVEDLESIKQAGHYAFMDADLIPPGAGVPIDYRKKLLSGM
jgi:hypothetical protein